MKRRTIYFNGRNLYAEQIAHLKGYYIDKEGELYYNGHKRTPEIYSNGYKKVRIRSNGDLINLKYHRLQAYQKYGDRIYKKRIEVRHLDNNPSNNSFGNIAIGTHSQNYHDSSPEVRQQVAQMGGDALRKFNHANVIAMHNWGLSYNQISEQLGIKKGQISWIINHSTEASSEQI